MTFCSLGLSTGPADPDLDAIVALWSVLVELPRRTDRRRASLRSGAND
jgi:hypothetical protein